MLVVTEKAPNLPRVEEMIREINPRLDKIRKQIKQIKALYPDKVSVSLIEMKMNLNEFTKSRSSLKYRNRPTSKISEFQNSMEQHIQSKIQQFRLNTTNIKAITDTTQKIKEISNRNKKIKSLKKRVKSETIEKSIKNFEKKITSLSAIAQIPLPPSILMKVKQDSELQNNQLDTLKEEIQKIIENEKSKVQFNSRFNKFGKKQEETQQQTSGRTIEIQDQTPQFQKVLGDSTNFINKCRNQLAELEDLWVHIEENENHVMQYLDKSQSDQNVILDAIQDLDSRYFELLDSADNVQGIELSEGTISLLTKVEDGTRTNLTKFKKTMKKLENSIISLEEQTLNSNM